MTALLAAAAAALAVAWGVRGQPGSMVTPDVAPVPAGSARRRVQGLWAVLAGVGVAVVVGGPAAPVLFVVGTAAAWWVVSRSEPASVRRDREQAARELPALVSLLGCALRAGAAPGEALEVVSRALDGPAARRLAPASARLALGVPPADVWRELTTDPVLAPLGRALARAHDTGAPVAHLVDRLGDDLARDARADAEDRARSVGVRAALPLGLCLLPAFVLIGVVPVAAGLVGPLLLGQ